MKWIDVSVHLGEERPVWPGDAPFRYEETHTIAAGAEANCARMSLTVHFGTHVDAPYHFVAGGRPIDQVPVDLLMGPCRVIALPQVRGTIEPEHLRDEVPPETRRLLVRTRNCEILHDTIFHTEYVAFSEASVRWLVGRGVRLLGIDYFSIAPWGNQVPAHVALLGAGGVAVENVDLSGVEPGPYELCCLPIKIRGSGGAPARVLLGRP